MPAPRSTRWIEPSLTPLPVIRLVAWAAPEPMATAAITAAVLANATLRNFMWCLSVFRRWIVRMMGLGCTDRRPALPMQGGTPGSRRRSETDVVRAVHGLAVRELLAVRRLQ